ncbi:MAG: ADP-glyceromanno-heptose 6-epimerase [Bacteriovoracaceae bacterium]|jgi:ADP-L-glycero-D-manno-heptose 6-epimerase|nr:ADP-glyceromanno-heptose 6-epimerase [Bacteriovoracaceae bacterium]
MIIVTGGAGFIGSCLIKELNSMGREDIIVVDRLESDQKWMNLRGLKYSEYIQADDFIEPETLYPIFEEGIDALYHMGACSSTTERDVDYLMYNNVDYSKIMFQVCTDFNVPLCYASSAATYGDGEDGYDDDESKIRSLKPLNAYGYSKQLVDEWALKLQATPEKWYGVKFFNVYGPNEYHKEKMSSVVYQAYNQIKATGKMKLFKSYKDGFEDGKQLRDFVYVKDVVNAMIALINDDHKGENGIYNLGTGKARSFLDLTKATFSALGINENIEYIEMPDSLKDQYQYFTEANMAKLNDALSGFEFHSLEDGVSDYVKNHLMNKNQFYC